MNNKIKFRNIKMIIKMDIFMLYMPRDKHFRQSHASDKHFKSQILEYAQIGRIPKSIQK